MGMLFSVNGLTALLTLVVLEIILNIDNLVFLSILTGKLPEQLQPRARRTGLVLALFLRYLLLALFSWLTTLIRPLFTLFGHGFSISDIILFIGGMFLIAKAVLEIHEHLEPEPDEEPGESASRFWVVVAQVVVLDAVFSLDSIITAIGLVRQLPIMLMATTIAMVIMLGASGPLSRFVNSRPTVMTLSLTFLLLIGISLLAEAVGKAMPEGYIYAAIGFAIAIEALNQIAASRRIKYESGKSMRQRTAEAVLGLLGGRRLPGAGRKSGVSGGKAEIPYAEEEIKMVSRVLTLSERTVRSIMTPRSEVEFIDLTDSPEEQLGQLNKKRHTVLPVCQEDSLDTVLGVAHTIQLLQEITAFGRIRPESLYPALMIPESMRVTKLLEKLRASPARMVFVTDEYGSVEGVITFMDLFEAIAGHVLDKGEKPRIVEIPGKGWLVNGAVDVHSLERYLEISGLVSESHDYTSLAGFLLARLGRLPEPGDYVDFAGYRFVVETVVDRRITEIMIQKPDQEPQEASEG